LQLDAFGHSALAAFNSAFADQVTLEVGYRGKQRREKPPLATRRIPQWIAERAEGSTGFADAVDQPSSSRVDRPRRSSLVTTTVSPALSEAISWATLRIALTRKPCSQSQCPANARPHQNGMKTQSNAFSTLMRTIVMRTERKHDRTRTQSFIRNRSSSGSLLPVTIGGWVSQVQRSQKRLRLIRSHAPTDSHRLADRIAPHTLPFPT
jgi:hypothetical protein